MPIDQSAKVDGEPYQHCWEEAPIWGVVDGRVSVMCADVRFKSCCQKVVLNFLLGVFDLVEPHKYSVALKGCRLYFKNKKD